MTSRRHCEQSEAVQINEVAVPPRHGWSPAGQAITSLMDRHGVARLAMTLGIEFRRGKC